MTDPRLRIAFMGTPDFSVPALAALRHAGHEIACVYTQPPRPKGRGYEVTPSPVHVYAQEHGILVFHPKSFKSAEEQEKFAAHKLDLAVVAAYGLILPKAVLNAPKYGCINIHASLLPRWRGASPIQRAIWAGDAETGVSLMQMDEGLDTGPIIAMRAVKIHAATTASSLHDELSALGAAMMTEAAHELAAKGHLPNRLQPEDGVTYAHLLKKDDGRVNWSQSADAIDRQIRALNPWPGVWCEFEGKRMKILEACVPPHPSFQDSLPPYVGGGLGWGGNAGKILDRAGNIQCGENTILQILKLQPPSGKAMDFAAALNGGHIKTGSCFA